MRTKELSAVEKQVIVNLRKDEKQEDSFAKTLVKVNTTICKVLGKKETIDALSKIHHQPPQRGRDGFISYSKET